MSDEAPRPLGDKSKITILIVEDRPDHVEIIQSYLKREGYRLVVARSRAEALERAEAESPDLVILDLRLDETKPVPEEGYEVCRWLREHPRTADVPVLIFTVWDQREYFRRAAEVYVDDYLVKFSSPEQVRSRVEKLLMVRHIKKKPRRMFEHLRLVEGGEDEPPAPALPGDG